MPELSLVLPVRARLLHDGGCWETTFSNPANVSKNDAAGFNAKSD
jgi:hypothetical protein